MELRINCDSVSVEGRGNMGVQATLNGVDSDDLLNEIPVKDVISHHGNKVLLGEVGLDDIVEHYGSDDLLATIGLEEAKLYFNLKESE